jgi:hypothetical protein
VMDVYQKNRLHAPGDHFGLNHEGRNILDRMFETTEVRHVSDEEISIRLRNAGLSPASTPDLAPAPLPGETS